MSARVAVGVAATTSGVILVAAAAASISFGSGLAAASSPPDVTGQKYSDASTALSSAGFSPVVSTTVGDQMGWSDCVVTRVQTRTEAAPENSSGSATNQALVSLNCDAAVASAKKAGNSAGSPAGQAAIAAAASSSAAAAASATPAAKQ